MKSSDKALRSHRVAGLSLGGGKTDRCALAYLDYYPEQRKVFLSHLMEKFKGDAEASGDFRLSHTLQTSDKKIDLLAFDVPYQLPKCLRCTLDCPGFESCQEPEILWMINAYEKWNRGKRPSKNITPYTERCAEAYVRTQVDEAGVISPHHTLGANLAPLTARAYFLQRRLNLPSVEVLPRLSLWRIGLNLAIPKSHLKFYRHAFDGEDARKFILNRLVERNLAFIYVQDIKVMIEIPQAFDAFIAAFTGVLKLNGQCEPKPKDFPPAEAWIEHPRTKISWFR